MNPTQREVVRPQPGEYAMEILGIRMRLKTRVLIGAAVSCVVLMLVAKLTAIFENDAGKHHFPMNGSTAEISPPPPIPPLDSSEDREMSGTELRPNSGHPFYPQPASWRKFNMVPIIGHDYHDDHVAADLKELLSFAEDLRSTIPVEMSEFQKYMANPQLKVGKINVSLEQTKGKASFDLSVTQGSNIEELCVYLNVIGNDSKEVMITISGLFSTGPRLRKIQVDTADTNDLKLPLIELVSDEWDLKYTAREGVVRWEFWRLAKSQ